MLHVQQFVFGPLEENTYIIHNDQKNCAIIDPGCYFGPEREQLRSYIIRSGLTPKLLLNTHCHLDHVFGNKFIAETFGLTLHLHQNEKPVLDAAPAFGLQWGLPFDPYVGEVVYLAEGTIQLDQDPLEVLFTPGHSPGSISFYAEAEGFVIGGDVLFMNSIGRTDLPGGDFDTLIQSIRTKFWVLPDATKVYSGHGAVTTIGREKAQNPFLT